MCGIFGALSSRGPLDVRAVARASAALRHRGPDAEGLVLRAGGVTRAVYDGDPVPDGPYTLAMASRRLAIIDVSGGAQPIANEDGTVWCVFNGEIYNFRELRDELTGLGHVFQTKSDTEVLCHAWEAWGPELVRRLNGMFAFALYDARRDVVVLARDHAGVKPLYYYAGEGTFAFASEVKALLAFAPEIRVCRDGVFDFFLFDQVPPPRTPFRAVFKLDAGELCVVRARDLAIETRTKYWDFRVPPRRWRREADAVAEVEAALDRAVARQAVADVPVATFLSGGIDSSLVTRALMTHTGAVTAFHMHGDDDPHSERPWTTNAGFGTLTRRYVDYAPTLPNCLAALHSVDALLLDPSILPTFLVSRAAAQAGFKVVLSGDGGDEMFAGYDTVFHAARLMERYRALGVRWWGRLPQLGRLIGPGHAAQLARYCAAGSVADAYYGVGANNLVSARKAKPGDVGPQGRHLPHDGLVPDGPDDDRPVLERLSYYHCRYVLNTILDKVDLASMASSLEVRVPLLDVELMELALSIPFEYKLRGRGKGPLKAIAARHFGHDFAYRDKQGFVFDLGALFRAPDVAAHLREGLARPGVDAYLDVASLRGLLEAHQARPAHGKLLWRGLMFTEWLRTWGAAHA
ncbi:MAG: asparagine synthase (glutamine-hydrolyzing) [Candidatus Rokubacteria bacterium]|nr:asparagine synthase (glutamine-hydrolyzing) [Candidatus Rokubacteria bacterium]